MAIYILLSFCMPGLFFLTNRLKGALKTIVIMLSLVLPCLIAAFRDNTIGTDVRVYTQPIFLTAVGNSYLDTINVWGDAHPIGFVSFIWLVTALTNSFPVVLGLLQLLVVVPVYKSLQLLFPKDIWLGMLMYSLLFFPASLNYMKQSVAMAMVILAFSYLSQRRIGPFLILAAVAVTFHQTALLMVPVYFLYYHLNSTENNKNSRSERVFFTAVAFGLIGIVFLFSDYLISYLGELRGSYLYLTNHVGQGSIDFTALLILPLIIIEGILTGRKRKSQSCLSETNTDVEREPTILFVLRLLCVIGYIFAELSIFTIGLDRVAMYFQYFVILFIPSLSRLSHPRTYALIFQCCFVLLSAVVMIRGLVSGNHAVYPYTSQILGIGA